MPKRTHLQPRRFLVVERAVHTGTGDPRRARRHQPRASLRGMPRWTRRLRRTSSAVTTCIRSTTSVSLGWTRALLSADLAPITAATTATTPGATAGAHLPRVTGRWMDSLATLHAVPRPGLGASGPRRRGDRTGIRVAAAGSRSPFRRPRGSRGARTAGVDGHRAQRRSRLPAQLRCLRGWRVR
jgi:hypothetical protein